jgi:thiamine kinase-like enzyme
VSLPLRSHHFEQSSEDHKTTTSAWRAKVGSVVNAASELVRKAATPALTPPPLDSERLHAVVQRLPEYAAQPYVSALLPGGLTNRNYRITGRDGKSAVVRLSSPESAAFGVDRDAEYANSASAASGGVAPAVLAYVPDLSALVIEWIEGPTFTAADLDDSDTLSNVAGMCRRLHAGPRFITDFNMFALQRRYLKTVEVRGYRRPKDYLDFMPMAERIEGAMSVLAEQTVPCHNDLLPANLMSDAADSHRLWFIDFEYAGNGDPCFDLGNLCSEAGLGTSRLEELVHGYYGAADATKVSRARLYALMSDYGWTLWACIAAATSELDFDFRGWGLEKYERARSVLRGPELPRLIESVQQRQIHQMPSRKASASNVHSEGEPGA